MKNTLPSFTINSIPTEEKVGKKERSSNLELYRIICMLMIVAHHYVVNSGMKEVLMCEPLSIRSLYYTLFGMWGKTGINCFVLITGYFMCTKSITLQKFLKLLCQIYFYKIVIFTIFAIVGKESLSLMTLFKIVTPFWSVQSNFTGSFLLFYLLIPFLSALVNNITEKQHRWLMIGCFVVYSVLGSIPTFALSYNYVGWFSILFIFASYIRLHPNQLLERTKLWGYLSVGIIIIAQLSVVICVWAMKKYNLNTNITYWFVEDSNKILAILVAITTFIWFKGIRIKQSALINTIAASTFGVLLIHANSEAMREWLWYDVLNVVGQYNTGWGNVLIHSVVGVLAIFTICIVIDQIRIRYLEPIVFKKK